MVKKRPKHLDLLKIKQPVPAIVSILHRISGALLYLFTPFLLYLLQASLASPESYSRFVGMVGNPLVKLLLLLLLWALIHHFCAGLRYLALDMHWGIALQPTRITSTVVLVISLLLTVLLGVKLW